MIFAFADRQRTVDTHAAAMDELRAAQGEELQRGLRRTPVCAMSCRPVRRRAGRLPRGWPWKLQRLTRYQGVT